jgi:hypothetical protein
MLKVVSRKLTGVFIWKRPEMAPEVEKYLAGLSEPLKWPFFAVSFSGRLVLHQQVDNC